MMPLTVYLSLSRQWCDVEGSVSLLGCGVYPGAPGEEFCDHADMSLFGRQVERVEAVAVAGVDVCVRLQVFQNLLQVAAPGGTKETGIVVGLKRKKKILKI